MDTGWFKLVTWLEKSNRNASIQSTVITLRYYKIESSTNSSLDDLCKQVFGSEDK